MEKVLIVEDELIVARDIRKTLERNGYKVLEVARTVEKAIAIIDETRPSLVLVDIFLKGELTGIDLAARLNAADIPFIYVSANSNQPVLEAANTTNPYGFIVKPFREKDLLVTINIAKYRHENRQIHRASLSPAASDPSAPVIKPSAAAKNSAPGFDGIVGRSAPMLHVFNLIQQVAAFGTSVLLLGESGTGKEVVANCIFQASGRSSKPFIKINCGAIPAALMESELFGYEKGAFTGALERKTGKFEQANGGTILLDEIGELPLDMQAKLLRVLQDKEIHRIGSRTGVQADVRIIAATARNLEQEVAAGKFRLDLYYRLYVFPILIPPLRDRKEDIPMLVHHFIRYYAARTGKNIRIVDDAVIEECMRYRWPGNVRELQFLVERTVVLSRDDRIREMIIPGTAAAQIDMRQEEEADLKRSNPEEERAYLLSILKQCNYRVRGKGGAAELLKMPPGTLHGKMKKFGIKKTYFG